MKLIPNWRDVLAHAWSLRLMLLAGFLSSLEVALPAVDQFIYVPPGLFAAASMIVTAFAFWARLAAQNPGAVFRRAWSIRLLVLAGLLSGLEVALPYLNQVFSIPAGAFAAASIVTTMAAFWARLIAQKGLTDAEA